jgi:hypothetical protein
VSVAVASRPRPLSAPAPGPPQLVGLRDRDGRRLQQVLGADAHAALLSELLHSERPGFVEVVGVRRLPNGRLGRFDRSRLENFVRAGQREPLLERVRELRSGDRCEVFVTPATLRVPVPGNDSVDRSAVAWVDIDDPRRLRTLRRFAHAPHAVIASGSGGAHAYWRLAESLSGERCEALNRMLAAALGADPASCNRGRIMRVPGSRNWKPARRGREPAWCRVVMCDLAKPPYSPAVLAEGLRDPKAPAPARRPRLPRPRSDQEPWAQLEAAEYYRAITGREPRRDGKVRCPNPAHEDRHPSAQLYPGAGAGWYCFACQAGGGAADMVAATHGYPTGSALRGEHFNRCVAELRRIFGVPEPPSRKPGAP